MDRFKDEVRVNRKYSPILSLDFNQIHATKKDLASLDSEFDEILSISTRIRCLPLNAFELPSLADDLRTFLREASQSVSDLDGEIQLHWDDESEVRAALASGGISLTPREIWTRRHEYDRSRLMLSRAWSGNPGDPGGRQPDRGGPDR